MKSIILIATVCLGVVALGFAFDSAKNNQDDPKPADTSGVKADTMPKDSSGKSLKAEKATSKGGADTVTTETGLKYLVRKEGDGPGAKTGQTVSVHYAGRLTDGTEFDNSYKRQQPIRFALGGKRVIAGLEEGLLGMKVGGARTLIIPSELGYGKRGHPGAKIPPDATLIFDIELVAIK